MSFERSYDVDIDFFTVGVSTIGGPDIIKGDGDVVQEWDKYEYTDFSQRLIAMEWTRQEDPINSVSLAIADFELNNTDDIFTPQAGSSIDEFILPFRPVKLFCGFKNEGVPGFIGLTEKMPIVDQRDKTARFHCIDFLYSLFNRPLDETIVMTDSSTDIVLDQLFQLAGLTSTQYQLDTGFNIVRFVYFPKGMKMGDAVNELMEAEQGRLYMDETGIIRFKNRQNFSDTPVWTFTPHNILDIQTEHEASLYNVVEIISKVRVVQQIQKAWQLSIPVTVPAGGEVEVWADFEDPVTTVNDPAYSANEVPNSYFLVNTREDGTGETHASNVTLSSSDLFHNSMKLTFANAGAVDYYLTDIVLWGTPARIVKEIYVREEDAASIAKYDERVLTIENNFIQREDEAYSKARILLDDYSEFGNVKTLIVKGNPALQIGDAIEVILPGIGSQIFTISRITNRYANGQYTQILTVKQRDPQHYFTVGESLIGGTDVIAP